MKRDLQKSKKNLAKTNKEVCLPENRVAPSGDPGEINQARILRKILPKFGEWCKRTFSETVHEETKLGGREYLDKFLKNGYIGMADNYNRAGVWAVTKEVPIAEQTALGPRYPVVMARIEFVVRDF